MLNDSLIRYLQTLAPIPPHWRGMGATRLSLDPRDWDIRGLPGVSETLAAGVPDSVDLTHLIQGPILDQGASGACFPAGTRIRMADGSEKLIEHVCLLDEVVTAEGRTGWVEATMVRRESAPLLEIHLRGHHLLRLTSEHPVLTQRGYVSAAELGTEDYVGLPRYLAERVQTIRSESYVPPSTRSRHAQREGLRRYAGRPGRRAVDVRVDALPETIHLSPDFGRIVGLFLAEGHTTDCRAIWTFGAHEAKTLAQELAELLRNTLGTNPYFQVRPTGVVNIILYGQHWMRLFDSLCATGSGNKRLHPDLCSGPKEFLHGVFEGWMDGDGHLSKEGRRDGVTISPDLALAMYDIAQALGLRPTISRSAPSMNRHAKTRRERWDVTYSSGNRPHLGSQQTETHVWRKVHEVLTLPDNGPTWVYNLQVHGDNSYVAEGIGVHNCVAFSTAGVCSMDSVLEKGAWEAIDAAQMYARAGGTGQNGVDSRLVLEQATDDGVPLAGSDVPVKLISSYAFVPQQPGIFTDTIKAALAAGYPLVVAMLLPADWGWQSGHGATTSGYHQVAACGYTSDGYLICLNSWGASWPGNSPHAGVGSVLFSFLEQNSLQQGYVFSYTVTPLQVSPLPPPPPPPPPVQVWVTGYSPNPVPSGAPLLIQGSGFGPDSSADWGTASLLVSNATPTALSATAPTVGAMASGPVTVMSGGQTASGPPLTITPVPTPVPPPIVTRTVTGTASGPGIGLIAVGDTLLLSSAVVGASFKVTTIRDNPDPTPLPTPIPTPTPTPTPGPGAITVHLLPAARHGQTVFIRAWAVNSQGAFVAGTATLTVAGHSYGDRSLYNTGVPAEWGLALPAGTSYTVSVRSSDGEEGSADGLA